MSLHYLPNLADALNRICDERTDRKSGRVAAGPERDAQTASPERLFQIMAGFGHTRPESIEDGGLMHAKEAVALKAEEPTEITQAEFDDQKARTHLPETAHIPRHEMFAVA